MLWWIQLLQLSLSVPLVSSSLNWGEYNQHVDVTAVTNELYAVVSLFNGGLDEDSGSSAYSYNFSGLFLPNLNRTWIQTPELSPYYPHIYPTVITQSQAIIINAQAFFAHPNPMDRRKFSEAVKKGAEALLTYGWDSKYGGFLWQMSGQNKQKDAEKRKFYGSDYAKKKSSEGQSYAIIALVNAFLVTNESNFLRSALDTLTVLNLYFNETAKFDGASWASAAGVLHDQNREFTDGENGFRYAGDVIRKLEALLVLSDALSGLSSFSSYRSSIDLQIQGLGSFIIQKLIQYPSLSTSSDQAFVYLYYGPGWIKFANDTIVTNNTQSNSSQSVSTGLTLNLAYHLFRATSRGYDTQYGSVAKKLVAFFLSSSAFENGVLKHIYTDEHGAPVDSETNIWWVYAEACRTLLHMALVHDCQSCLSTFDAIYTVAREKVMDQEYMGWYEQLDSTGEPLSTVKGHIFKTPEPEVNFYAEVVRLASLLLDIEDGKDRDGSFPSSPSSNNDSFAAKRWGISLVVILGCLLIVVGVAHCAKSRSQNVSSDAGVWSRVFGSREYSSQSEREPVYNSKNDYFESF